MMIKAKLLIVDSKKDGIYTSIHPNEEMAKRDLYVMVIQPNWEEWCPGETLPDDYDEAISMYFGKTENEHYHILDQDVPEVPRDGVSSSLCGVTGVDSGRILITDPCYIGSEYGVQEAHLNAPSIGVAGVQLRNKINVDIGVIVGDFGGDGVFPIYAIKDELGRTIRVEIRFQ